MFCRCGTKIPQWYLILLKNTPLDPSNNSAVRYLRAEYHRRTLHYTARCATRVAETQTLSNRLSPLRQHRNGNPQTEILFADLSQRRKLPRKEARESMTNQNHQWRNRIVGHGTLTADEIINNPLNWRAHPDKQKAAMTGALAELGWLEEVRVNKQTGFLVDGHLRVALAKKFHQSVPVTYLDLTPDEERRALLSFDPIASMAEANKDNLERLLRETSFESPPLTQLATDLAKQYKIALDDALDGLGVPTGEEQQNYHEQYGVLVLCEDEAEQASVYAELQQQGYERLKVVST